MKWCIGLVAALSLVSACSAESAPEKAKKLSPEEELKQAAANADGIPPSGPIRRCINIGNALDAPKEGAWGYSIEDEHIREIARAGFDTLRLPIRWNAHALKSAPYTIDPAFFDRVDHVLNVALEAGLGVILDLHHYSELMDDPNGQEARFYALWEQIAAHYSDAPDNVYFEVLNEPTRKLKNDKLKTIYPRALDIIRRSNPDRWVIFSGDGWGSLRGMVMAELPDAPRVIWTYHTYQPWKFTHQGARHEKNPPPVGTGWGTPEDYQFITDRTKVAAHHGATNDKPILLGEFGVYPADGASPYEDRIAWLSHMRESHESRNMGWCVWNFASSFELYDVNSSSWDEGLLNALLSK